MLALLLATPQAETPYRFEVHPTEGLRVTVRGVPVVAGTWFQVYEPDWSKQYFGSGRGGEIKTEADGTVQFRFRSPDGLVSGTQTYRPEGDRLRVRYRFEWGGERPVRVEATAGMINAPAVQAGALVNEGVRTELSGRAYPKGADLNARRLTPDATRFRFDAPLAEVEATTSRPLTLFDARGYDQEWARNQSLLWFGLLDAEVSRERPLEFEVEWRFAPKPAAPPKTERLDLPVPPIPNAENPDETPLPLVPRPKDARLDPSKPVEVTGTYRYPVGRVRFWEDFKQGVAQRFILPTPARDAKPLTVDAGVSKLGRKPGGYEITIRADGRVSVLGEEDEGLRNGLRRLATLVFAKGGKLWLPTGTLKDEPALTWRGVHLFVGPEARAFQRRLWDRVLSPMGFNQVVLQCERTQWKSVPLDPSLNPMGRESLAGLFADYRARGVEPTPLIQSLGHMEWFFAGNRRLDLAMNPEAPYTIDPRKPETVETMRNLWAEAAELLSPKTMHFGCDEIDMRGFAPESHGLATEIWEKMMPELGKIAREHEARMMIWGDNALAPGEAVDATHGHSKEEADRRRRAIPKGASIADWHYRGDPRPQLFYPSLQLWKREGFRPIASGWYTPDNIRGFTLAADLERVGYLQTTWAGYESNEANMLLNLDQFSAMILAADYAWSARQDPVANVGYDPGALFQRLYFGRPSPVRPIPGRSVGNGEPFRVGTLGFRRLTPIRLRSLLVGSAVDAPSEIEIPVTGPVARLALALDAGVEAADGETIAEVAAEFADGTVVRRPLQYGRHVRTPADVRVVPYGLRQGELTGTVLELGRRGNLRRLRIRSVGSSGGLGIHGVTLW
jgi:hypothetical protein